VSHPRPEYVLSLDRESFLLRPGVLAPPTVCIQHKLSKSRNEAAPGVVLHMRDPKALEVLTWALQHALIVGHYIAGDMAGLCSHFPHLTSLVFEAYAANRITDTGLRQKLADIARGVSLESQSYGLDDLAEEHLGVTLNKSDKWRLLYGTLWTVDVEQWPPDALAYALGDIDAQHGVYWVQEEKYRGHGWLENEYAQARADFWLTLASAHGIHTDPQRVPEYYGATLVAADRDKAIAQAAGLVRRDGTKDTKAAMLRMVATMEALGEEPSITDTGLKKIAELTKAQGRAVTWREVWTDAKGGPQYISLDEDACLASGDPVLEAYQRYGSLRTRLSRAERLYRGFDLPIQARFNALVETGRTSCTQGEVEPGVSPVAWGVQLQNMNTGMEYNPDTKRVEYKPGMRECFIPRVGAPSAHA
jgi:hypothetical protein